MIQEAFDNYVHAVYREIYETLQEGTQQIRVDNTDSAKIVTNNGYVYNPDTENMDGSLFFTGCTIHELIRGKVSGFWLLAEKYPELAEAVRKILPEAVEKENKWRLSRLESVNR